MNIDLSEEDLEKCIHLTYRARQNSVLTTDENLKKYMRLAFRAAQNSTCARRRVGAVITTLNGEVISKGWNHSSNGVSCEVKFFTDYVQKKNLEKVPSGLGLYLKALTEAPLVAHQYESYLDPELLKLWNEFKVYTKTPEFKELHREWQDTEIHSELSAIMNAHKQGSSTQNCILFSSRSPCIPCAHAIIESGIKVVYYTELSVAGEGGIPILDQAGITTYHLEVDHDYYT